MKLLETQPSAAPHISEAMNAEAALSSWVTAPVIIEPDGRGHRHLKSEEMITQKLLANESICAGNTIGQQGNYGRSRC
jgi:hypothetical protein